ncbi:MAG TPA: hypothetical protein VLB74_04885 [Flavobacterium sp.]|uniref:hypothetical protein n=1 Tax=Flavobacterium sp. TaxID=239 RepID=UPI002B6EC6D4|nr:hypothetical protein [Flavobacterium sp.]HSD13962.1 hypothetical protein [Flavobacterium sp.]
MKKIFFLLLIFAACSKKNTVQKPQKTDPKTTHLNSIKEEKLILDDSLYYDLQKAEVMDQNDILFNGKLTRYFNLKEFENVFGKPDSLILMSKEEPCNYEFENEDGSKDLEDKYIYKDGSRFENSKDKVAVDEFKFTDKNFINYRGIIMNAKTTKNDLKKYFPYAIENIGILDVYDEGPLEVITLREDAENNSEGHIMIFFKNDRLYLMHWWFPC